MLAFALGASGLARGQVMQQTLKTVRPTALISIQHLERSVRDLNTHCRKMNRPRLQRSLCLHNCAAKNQRKQRWAPRYSLTERGKEPRPLWVSSCLGATVFRQKFGGRCIDIAVGVSHYSYKIGSRLNAQRLGLTITRTLFTAAYQSHLQ